MPCSSQYGLYDGTWRKPADIICVQVASHVLIGNVEDQQMILSRRFADFVSLLRGELDVIGLARMTEDDAVETAMILKLSEY